MAKDKITDYDATAANNLDVGGISVAEGMLPSGVNNAMRELMSHQKEAFGSGTPLYVDQVNNRVGINQAAPAHPVHVGTDDLIVDASGNLLVGTTTGGGTIGTYNGFGALAGGTIFSSATSNRSIFARRSTDGSIIDFRKDGTTVGSIGVYASRLYAGTGDVGLWFNDQSDYIAPINAGTSALRDAAIDIGNSSYRFKDLYLSGGVVFGTGGPSPITSNTLDDYEEGTWTPAFCDASSGGNEFGYTGGREGFYTKVGCMVTVWFYGRTDGITTGITTSNQLFIQGLPFTSNMGSNGTANGVRSSTQGTLQANTGSIFARVYNGVTYLAFEKQFGDTAAPYSVDSLLISEWEGGDGANITGFMTYRTDS